MSIISWSLEILYLIQMSSSRFSKTRVELNHLLENNLYFNIFRVIVIVQKFYSKTLIYFHSLLSILRKDSTSLLIFVLIQNASLFRKSAKISPCYLKLKSLKLKSITITMSHRINRFNNLKTMIYYI